MPISGGVGIGAPPGQARAGYGKQTGITGPPKSNFGSGINWNKFVPKPARGPYTPQQGTPAAAAVNAPPKASPQQAQGAEQSNPGGNDNLDATYFANTNANQFDVNNKVNALTQQGAQNEVALQSALSQLAYQQPRSQLSAMQAENARGGLYSSVEGQQQGDIVHGYNERQNAAESSAQSSRDQIAAQIAALEGGVPLYNAGQALASVGRLSKIAAANPAITAPGASGSAGGSATAPPGAAGTAPATNSGTKGGAGSFASSPAVQALAAALAKGPVLKKGQAGYGKQTGTGIGPAPKSKGKGKSGGAGI